MATTRPLNPRSAAYRNWQRSESELLARLHDDNAQLVAAAFPDEIIQKEFIALGSVGTLQLENASVTGDILAYDSVGSDHIKPAAVTPEKLDRAYAEV